MRTIGAAITFFGLVLLAIIAYTGWSDNEAAIDRERNLIENALNHRIARVLNEQKSVAWWDESVTKIAEKTIDLDFAETEFGIFLTETYGHDEVHILNGEDRPIYSFFDAKQQDPSDFGARRPAVEALIAEARRGRGPHSNLRTRPDTFGESQSNHRILAGPGQAARWAGHIVSVEGRPAVVAAMTIVPNINTNLLKGTPNLLVGIKYIDEAF
ncbi:MAG TPA: CHASE4 domain-containing protein, partial [Anaerolineales bacterium]|nr:CHASE4 domain-containing protein [Anaerolineales bacterium]